MTHTLAQIRAEYDRLDALCGVNSAALSLEISQRMHKTYGKCYYGPSGPTRIVIAAFVMETENEPAFWEIVRHEYAHALVALRRPGERHGHDALWRAACAEVGCAPERCMDDAILRRESRAHERQSKRARGVCLRATCRRCGSRWRFESADGTLGALEGRRYREMPCPRCGASAFRLQNGRALVCGKCGQSYRLALFGRVESVSPDGTRTARCPKCGGTGFRIERV